MKTVLQAFLALFITTSAFSQTTLEGKISDYNTGEHIPFATVSLYQNDSLSVSTIADLEGNYIFPELLPGNYSIESNYIGYSSKRIAGIYIKAEERNKMNLTIIEGALLDEVVVLEYKEPLIETDYTTSGSTVTSEEVRSMPTKNISGMKAPLAGLKAEGDISVRGSRSAATTYYIDGVKVSSPYTFSGSAVAGAPSEGMREDLPESGQMTAGEWNDLHNWKDWMTLLENEEYGIMTNRYEIYPTERYSVLAINKTNNVIPNSKVELLDRDGSVIWEAYTDNAGKAELWANAMIKGQNPESIRVYDGRNWVKTTDIRTIEEGSNTVTLNKDCFSPSKVDIVFTVDATSSMSDEIFYLKSELLDVINRIKDTNDDIDFQLGSVFYRDVKDEYLTKVSVLDSDIEKTITFVAEQNAKGGGDYPEAVESALEETLNINWREDALKIAFLILDAPPREDEETIAKIRTQIQEAAAKGIKLIPVTASGINRETEFLMKFMAIMTNGTYVFITDDSGIGNPHLDPVVDDYEVEKLNDCLARLISQYSKSYSCEASQDVAETLEVKVFPNPCTQYININTSDQPDKIKLLSSNGMLVKSITPQGNSTRIEMDDLVNGVYTVSVYKGKTVESKQVILIK